MVAAIGCISLSPVKAYPLSSTNSINSDGKGYISINTNWSSYLSDSDYIALGYGYRGEKKQSSSNSYSVGLGTSGSLYSMDGNFGYNKGNWGFNSKSLSITMEGKLNKLAQKLYEKINPKSAENRQLMQNIAPTLKEKLGADAEEYAKSPIETSLSLTVNQTDYSQMFKLLTYEQEQKILQTGLSFGLTLDFYNVTYMRISYGSYGYAQDLGKLAAFSEVFTTYPPILFGMVNGFTKRDTSFGLSQKIWGIKASIDYTRAEDIAGKLSETSEYGVDTQISPNIIIGGSYSLNKSSEGTMANYYSLKLIFMF